MNFTDNNFQLSATDLSNHLSCRHLTELNRKVALGELNRPHWNDPQLEILIERGHAHEKAYVNFLKASGKTVVIGSSVVEAMSQGVDVIVQARLELRQWLGLADILIKVPGNSRFGDWQYEVQDTKLAQNTKAGTILQLCLYSDLIAELQGVEPEKFHVIKPASAETLRRALPAENFEPESYRFDDFKAYYRITKKNFEQIIIDAPKETYPEPAEHCGICRWWKVCDTRRHDDDYISLVAGIRSSQIEEMKTQGVRKLKDFATLEKIAEPKRGNIETYVRRQAQAKIQLEGRIKEQLIYNNLPPEPNRGLNRLPEPNRGDIYFDIEGDEYYPDGGLEYILGYCYQENDQLVYQNRWSRNRTEEKHAFSEFMKLVMDRWKRNPDMYIYHFAPYEPTAIKRLARVHATYEREVDDLLRAEKFIDLHAVFKEALLASVESYSLKSLEHFTKYTRKVELVDASRARKKVEVALELNDPTLLTNEIVKTTEDYNEDDCRATQALHEWLEGVRADLIVNGKTFQRPEIKTGEANEKIKDQDARSAAIFQGLIARLPEDRSKWTAEDHSKWLLAHQVDYFRRELKSAVWEYYRVHELEVDDVYSERRALTGLKFMGVQPKEGKERNITHRYSFPSQECDLDKGDGVTEVKGPRIGSIRGISVEDGDRHQKKS